MASAQPNDELAMEDLIFRLNEAEGRLADLAREVDHLQRLSMVGTLAAGVVHEINNQLTPALAQAQMARLRPDEPAPLRDALDRCIDGITHASRIAETISHFASPAEPHLHSSRDKSSAHDDRPGPPAANIAQVVKTALACLGGAHSRAGIRLDIDVPPDAWVRIEPLALQQVLLNLLLNAIKALSETREPAIRIRASLGEPRASEPHTTAASCIITVEDNGPGIPPAIRTRLFNAFATAPITARASKGSGLGLAVSRRLIQFAGGSIDADECCSSGASFTIRLASISRPSRAKSI